MKKSPLIVEVSQVGEDYVSNVPAQSKFVVKPGQNLIVRASPVSEKDKRKFIIQLESDLHVPWWRNGQFQFLTLLVSLCLAIISAYSFHKMSMKSMSDMVVEVQKESQQYELLNISLDSIVDAERQEKSIVESNLKASVQKYSNLRKLVSSKDSTINSLKANYKSLQAKRQADSQKLSQLRLNISELEGERSRLVDTLQAIEAGYRKLQAIVENQRTNADANSMLQTSELNTLRDSISFLNKGLAQKSIEDKRINTLMANAFEGMDYFYNNRVLWSRNYEHALMAIENLDKLINDYGRTEYQPIRDSFYKRFQQGIERRRQRN